MHPSWEGQLYLLEHAKWKPYWVYHWVQRERKNYSSNKVVVSVAAEAQRQMFWENYLWTVAESGGLKKIVLLKTLTDQVVWALAPAGREGKTNKKPVQCHRNWRRLTHNLDGFSLLQRCVSRSEHLLEEVTQVCWIHPEGPEKVDPICC